VGFADDWNLVDAWILTAGGQQVNDFDAPTRFTFADKKALAGILARWQMAQKDRVMPTAYDNQALSGGPSVQFVQGHLAMFHSGLWKTPGFRSIQAFDWDVAPFPRKKGVKPRYWGGGSGYGIRADAKDPALCWELVKFMAGPIGQQRLAAAGLAQPALRAMAKSPAFLDGQKPLNKKMLLDCAERMQTPPAWTRWTEFSRTIWAPLTDPIWLNGYQGDPAAVIRQVQAVGNERFFGIKPPRPKPSPKAARRPHLAGRH
jgi:multiple sugar transport system substrate-binding protein